MFSYKTKEYIVRRYKAYSNTLYYSYGKRRVLGFLKRILTYVFSRVWLAVSAIYKLVYGSVIFSLVAVKYNAIIFRKEEHIDFILSSMNWENTFKDSGYWDYVLLSLYDYYYNLIFVYTVFILSDYTIIEKASWRFISSVMHPLNKVLFDSVSSVGEMLTYVILFLISMLLICLMVINLLYII